MNQDINLTVEEAKQNIINTINNTGLPISVVYYIMKDIMNDMTDSYNNYLIQAKRQLEQAAAAPTQSEETESED